MATRQEDPVILVSCRTGRVEVHKSLRVWAGADPHCASVVADPRRTYPRGKVDHDNNAVDAVDAVDNLRVPLARLRVDVASSKALGTRR